MATLGGPAVGIVGLIDLQRDLRRASSELPKELRLEHLEVARLIAQWSRARASSLGGVHTKASEGISSGAQQRSAEVRLNAYKHPYILGAEFGGGARPTTRQFPPWRGNGKNAGYMVYPSIRENEEEILNEYDGIFERLLGKADEVKRNA